MSTDNLLLLPVDILVLIFRNLRKSDLRNVMLTCKTLRDFIKSENRIWRPLAQGSLVFQESTDNRWFHLLSWYNRYRISNNWQRGCYKTKVLVHYYTNYMPWIVLKKSEVLLSSVGSELVCYRTDNKGMPNCNKTLWKLEVPKVIRHDVRTNDISRFVMRDARIVCGNRDGCVAVYKVNNNNIMKKPKLEVHIKDCHDQGDEEVSAVELISSRDMLSVLTGSSDVPELFLYNMRSGNQIIPNPNGNQHIKRFPVENIAGIKSLSLNTVTNQIAIGPNGNNLPAIFDVRTGQFLMAADATPNHRQAVRDIQWRDENTIVYVTHSGFLQMLDTRSRELAFKTRDPFQSTLYCGKTDGANCIMVGSAEYSRCVLFDARKPTHHVQMYFTQRNTSPVYCLEFDSTKLISAVDRGIALLNFNIDGSTQEQRDYSRHVFH